MPDIPRAVLSEQLQERISKRRLVSAVFLTYLFDPGFFEQEILPVLLDVPLSHATPIRLVQLEDALRDLPGQIAVYYDANGLVAGDAGSAKLDIRRLPVQHRTGIFHPKNFFILVEDDSPDETGHRARALLVGTLSANLTRNGWWENVEVCHTEEIIEGDKTRLRDDLIAFLNGLRHKVAADDHHHALRDILDFLRATLPRAQRSSDDVLHIHFYTGREAVADFLENVAGARLDRTYLEIISPFFDDADDCRPLRELIARFQPREIRIHLPETPSGEVLCRETLYRAVLDTPGVSWGRLPGELLRMGQSQDAGTRSVHAKVYRFFTQNPKREIYFIGSANLTTAAHQSGGNLETGFLIEVLPERRPDFWLTPQRNLPAAFHARSEDETAASGGTRLNLRYRWDRAIADAFWDAPGESPILRLESRGVELGMVGPLVSRTWIPLGPEFAARLADILAETSFVYVVGDGTRLTLLLVQEEGMSHKPSILIRLSVTEILRYWSLLTPEQRSAFLEARAPEVSLLDQGADLVVRARRALESDTLFDRFAGFFHAFGSLERSVRSALDQGTERDATCRLFGKKYDSLGCLLGKIKLGDGVGDEVDQYVILLCARQLCREIARDYQDFWRAHRDDVACLEEHFRSAEAIRTLLIQRDHDGLPQFLDWFDAWFLQRAEPVEIEE